MQPKEKSISLSINQCKVLEGAKELPTDEEYFALHSESLIKLDDDEDKDNFSNASD